VPIEQLQYIAPWPEQKEQQAKDTLLNRAKHTVLPQVELPVWLAKHRSAVITPKLEGFLKAAKASHDKVFGVGFCWGSHYALQTTHPDSPLGGFVTAVAAVHPSMLQDGDIPKIHLPTIFVVGGNDEMFDYVKEEPIIKKVGGEIKVHADCVHGWSVRGDNSKPEIRRAKEAAHKEVLEFFKKHL